MNKGLVTRSVEVRSLTPEQIENRQVEFVISTESPDTYGTVFKIDGWQLERYNRNPIVCYNHKAESSDPNMVIGTSQLRVEDGQLVALVTFETADVNPVADTVFRKVQAGTLRMASINAIVKEYRFGIYENGENPEHIYFEKQELLEWSIVSVGSNPDALKRSVDFIEEIKQENKVVKRSLAVTEAELNLKLKLYK